MGNSRFTTIGLFGPWGFGNLGCAATQDAVIQNIRKYNPNVDIFGFSLIPKDTEERHGIPSYRIGRDEWSEYDQKDKAPSRGIAGWSRLAAFPLFNRAAYWVRRLRLEGKLVIQTFQRLKKLDVLIVSGGGQLLDFWGKYQHPYWLFKYAILSKLAGTKLFFVSVGAGPIHAKISKFFIKTALSLASYRSYRDEESKRYVEKVLGFKRDDPVYPDLAYSIRVNDYYRTVNRPKVVGIGVMPYYDPRSWPENDPVVYRAYLDKLASFVTWLVNQGYAINLLLGDSNADRKSVKDLIGLLEKSGVLSSAGERISEEPIESVDDLFCQITNTDFVVASRFHNVLLSTIQKKPVIALSYHPKIDSLMKDSGQSAYCLPIDRFSIETLEKSFLDLQVHCAEIQNHFEELNLKNRMTLEEQYARIFNNL